jgi:hypothetical protein
MDFGWVFIIYIILCILVGVAASSKGRGVIAWTFISFLVSPVLGGFFVAFMRNNQNKGEKL